MEFSGDELGPDFRCLHESVVWISDEAPAINDFDTFQSL